jgi:hypothetical protein
MTIRIRARAPTAWLVAGAILTTATIVVGAVTVGLWLARQSETQRDAHDLSAASISLDLPGIDATVATGDAATLTIERRLTWSVSRPTIEERWDGQTLQVIADCPSIPIGPGCDVDYTLYVPPGVAVQLRTTSGDLVIHGTDGALQLSTSSGDVRATDLRSTEVVVSARSGDVDLGFTGAPQQLDIDTTSGDIDIAVPATSSYRLQVDADQTTLDIPQDLDAGRTIMVNSTTGSLHIRGSEG